MGGNPEVGHKVFLVGGREWVVSEAHLQLQSVSSEYWVGADSHKNGLRSKKKSWEPPL